MATIISNMFEPQGIRNHVYTDLDAISNLNFPEKIVIFRSRISNTLTAKLNLLSYGWAYVTHAVQYNYLNRQVSCLYFVEIFKKKPTKQIYSRGN